MQLLPASVVFISGHVFSQGPSSPGAMGCHISPGGHPAGRPSACCLCQLGIQPRSPALLDTPQRVPYLPPSHAASWHQQPSISHACPSDPLKHWPRQSSRSNHSYPPHLCISSTLSHPKVWPARQKLRGSLLLLFALRAGPPSFSSQAGCFGTCQAWV